MDKTIRIWNAQPSNTLGKPIYDAYVRDVTISPDGRWIVANDYGMINIWDAQTVWGAQTLKRAVPPLVGGSEDFSISRDGSRIASLNAGKVSVWDANTGERLNEWSTGQQLNPPFGWIALSPDGQKIATFGGTVDNLGLHQTVDMSIIVWNAKSGKQIGAPLDEHIFVTSAAFSPDSRYLA